MVQPSELLKDFGVTWIVGDDAFVGVLGTDMLHRMKSERNTKIEEEADIRLSVVRRHARFGTKCRPAQEGWGDS